jgi:formyltetrahydrofolate hydrolase
MTVTVTPASQATSRVSDYVLTFSCPDQPGIVYSVAKFLPRPRRRFWS